MVKVDLLALAAGLWAVTGHTDRAPFLEMRVDVLGLAHPTNLVDRIETSRSMTAIRLVEPIQPQRGRSGRSDRIDDGVGCHGRNPTRVLASDGGCSPKETSNRLDVAPPLQNFRSSLAF